VRASPVETGATGRAAIASSASHPHRSITTVDDLRDSLPPSCLVVTLTIQPALRSDSASGCSMNPVFPGSDGSRKFNDL